MGWDMRETSQKKKGLNQTLGRNVESIPRRKKIGNRFIGKWWAGKPTSG